MSVNLEDFKMLNCVLLSREDHQCYQSQLLIEVVDICGESSKVSLTVAPVTLAVAASTGKRASSTLERRSFFACFRFLD